MCLLKTSSRCLPRSTSSIIVHVVLLCMEIPPPQNWLSAPQNWLPPPQNWLPLPQNWLPPPQKWLLTCLNLRVYVCVCVYTYVDTCVLLLFHFCGQGEWTFRWVRTDRLYWSSTSQEAYKIFMVLNFVYCGYVCFARAVSSLKNIFLLNRPHELTDYACFSNNHFTY